MQSKTQSATTILITGASSGLGAALAKAYARPGIVLLLTGRNEHHLAEVAKSCRTLGATVVEKAPLDVRNSAAMEQWITEMDTATPVDLVIANAGVSAGTADGMESDEQIDTIFATNINGVLNTISPLVPRMTARQKGQIALVSSLAGYRGLPSSPAYSGSKAAVRVYGEGLRGSLMKKNVGVTVITPGYIKTPMTDVNNFPMPFLMEADKAASLIKYKLRSNPARIAFPWPLYAVIWLMSCLPPCVTDPIFVRLPGKAALPRS